MGDPRNLSERLVSPTLMTLVLPLVISYANCPTVVDFSAVTTFCLALSLTNVSDITINFVEKEIIKCVVSGTSLQLDEVSLTLISVCFLKLLY